MAEHAIDNREVGASIAPPWTMRPSSNGIGLGPLNRQWQFESARVLQFDGVWPIGKAKAYDTIMAEVKICSTCEQERSIGEFHKRRLAKDGSQIRNSKCKYCMREYLKQHYRSNREYYRDKNRNAKRALRAKLLEYLMQHPCSRCKESDPIVLEFHHLRDKKFSIAKMFMRTMAWETLLKEIEKCIVLCSNCHKRETARAAGWYKFLGRGRVVRR